MKKHTAIEALETRIAPATVFAVNNANTLFSFDSEAPGTLSAGIPITGLGGGQVIKAMDFNPANGELFGIAISGTGTFTGQLFKINTTTGVATAPGAAFSTTLTTATGYDMEFEPTTGEIRVVNTDEANLRILAHNGAYAANPSSITGVTSLNAIAYTNNFGGATSTTLYGVNFASDDLMLIGGLNSNPSPNNGGVATKVDDIDVVAAANTGDRLGLDIHTTLEGNTAYYTGVVGAAQNLYTLNLATGAATLVGAIGNGTTPIFDIAVQPVAALAFPDGKSFTYTDADGDLVTVKTSVGTLKSSQFSWLASADGTRRELTAMNIVSDTTFTGANLTITAKKTATGGDGRVEVGKIFATNVNLGAVKIGGNIEYINVGTNTAGIPAVKSFDALSFGRVIGAPDGQFLISNFFGTVPVFKVKTDINGASIFFKTVGSFSVGGSIIGADAGGSGEMRFPQSVKSVTIGGSLIGGDRNFSGAISGAGIGLLKIGGDIIGGSGENSGWININGSAKTFIIGGSVVGGAGKNSGYVFNPSGDTLKIGGSVIGGSGQQSGSVTGFSLKSFAIGGSIVGGAGSYSDCASAAAGTAKLAGSIIAGTGSDSGCFSLGSTKSLFIGGSVNATQATGGQSGFLYVNDAKTVTIKGGLIGSPEFSATVSVSGNANPASVAASVAIGSLNIGGSVIHGEIFVGNPNSNVNAAAGKITIGGDFLASSISAGFRAGTDGNFGTADDTPAAMNTLPDIKAAIASIVIKGRAAGTISDGDHYGIVAEQLGSVSIAGRKLPLAPAAQDNQLVGPYADLRIRELAIP